LGRASPSSLDEARCAHEAAWPFFSEHLGLKVAGYPCSRTPAKRSSRKPIYRYLHKKL
jgi:hypothetical protein